MTVCLDTRFPVTILMQDIAQAFLTNSSLTPAARRRRLFTPATASTE